MAKSDSAPLDSDEGTEKKSGSGGSAKKIIIIAIGALAIAGASVGATLFLTNSPGAKKDAASKSAAKKADAEGEDADNADEEQEGAGKEGDNAEDAAEDGKTGEKKAVYYDFDQPFVVNFQDETQLRYLQITVSVMSNDPKTAESIKAHMPLIRNNLVLLFSGQSREAMITREGKEKIRAEAQAEVQKVLKEQTGKAGIKSLYFTSFVMQ